MKLNFKNKKQLLLKLKDILENKNSIIISGGNSIKDLFRNYKNQIVCDKILLSDERIVKKNSNLRNDFFFKNLIKKKIIKTKKFINYEHDELDNSKVDNFSEKIKKLKFDYALLSLGSNGHFASIFRIDNKKDNFYHVKNSPKFPKNRVTVSLSKISKCKKIIFIASKNKKKKEILNFKRFKLIKKLPKSRTCLYYY